MKFQAYSIALGDLARSKELKLGDRTRALKHLLKLVSDTMGVRLVSYWQFTEDRAAIVTECAYDAATQEWTSGARLEKKTNPRYFAKLDEERVIVIADCKTDPLAQGFKVGYLDRLGIHSLIDAPVIFDGEMVGILCCEETSSARDWETDDKFFALSCADFVGRILETDRRLIFESHLKATMMALPFCVALLNRDFRFLAVSDLWRQGYPFTVEDPIGKRISDVTTRFQAHWQERMSRVIQGEELRGEEESIQTARGQMWVTWSMIPWKSYEGVVEGLLIVYEDITQRKETDFQLRQATKLTALGEMAGGIAHEINNPLSILKGFIDLMRRQIMRGNIDLNSFQLYMDRAYNTADRISRIVKGMKRIARDSSSDEIQPYGLNVIVDDALDFVQEKFRDSGIGLRTQRLEKDVLVNCRPVEISQVLLNLLTNSFAAVEGQKEGWINVSCHVSKKSALIAVEDSGAGIPESIQEKIFQPFFTTKDIGKGTGLGLSISRRILEGHGGQLYLDTHAPKTRFVLELPLG